MMRGLACFLFLMTVGLAPVARAQPADIRIDVDRAIEETRGALVGLGWNTRELERVAPLRPHTVRIDGELSRLSPGPGELRVDRLLDQILRVRSTGAEPLVILYPLPEWLGEARAAACTPTIFFPEGCSARRVRPDDLDAWESLIEEIVLRAATAEPPAYLFESWNEPDLPIFWHDTREAFLETAAATHRAVARVAEDTGLPVRIGGPGSSFPEFAAEYARTILGAGLPLHFVSWHWYANNPKLGPDGAEGNIDPALYEALAGVNPDMTPAIYGDMTRDVREAIAPLLEPGRAPPELIIDEWNVSAGGLDLRHDSNEGAAFVAASLIEMERAGLDRALLYRSNSNRERPGDWGILDTRNRRKPSWWALRAFQLARGQRLALEGDDPAGGLWARASRKGNAIDVLLSNFQAVDGRAREVTLSLRGDCDAPNARISSLHADSPTLGWSRTVRMPDGPLALELPAQSVTWLRLSCRGGGRTSCLPGVGASRRCRTRLPRGR